MSAALISSIKSWHLLSSKMLKKPESASTPIEIFIKENSCSFLESGIQAQQSFDIALLLGG